MISILSALAVIVIVIFAFRMLWNPPKKHKEFSPERS